MRGGWPRAVRELPALTSRKPKLLDRVREAIRNRGWGGVRSPVDSLLKP